MSASSSPPSISPAAVIAARVVLIVACCGLIVVLPYLRPAEETQIVSYTAPKETVRKMTAEATPKGEPARVWGVILPRESDLWFFKLTGPIEEVAALEPKLGEFLQTVNFDGSRPTWTAPADWQAKPGNEFRFATLVIPGSAKPLDLAISKLPRGGDPLPEQLLKNVNRWRGQVALPELKLEELADQTERRQVAGGEATIVHLEGVVQPNTMTPPFARGR